MSGTKPLVDWLSPTMFRCSELRVSEDELKELVRDVLEVTYQLKEKFEDPDFGPCDEDDNEVACEFRERLYGRLAKKG